MKCLPIATALLATLWSNASAADEPSDACIAAFESAQTLRQAGRLLEARATLIQCAQAECPGALVQQCSAWYDEVERDTPGFVVTATDAGRDVIDVRVIADGTVIAESLTGVELRLDPGPHVLRFEMPGKAPREQQVLLRVGERRRNIEVVFDPPPPAHAPLPPPPPAPPPLPSPRAVERGWEATPLFWIGLGALAVGGGVGTATGLVALSRADALEDACARDGCTSEEIADGEVVAHVSTAAFALAGAGAVLLTIGAVLGIPEAESGAVIVTPSAGALGVGWRSRW